jgi:predicted nucleic acid-binding protein
MVVLDSSFLVAFHNQSDAHHFPARKAFDRLVDGEWGEILLLEYVFLEIVTVLAARRDLPTAVSVGEILLRAREIGFVPCSGYFLGAYEIFREQREIRLSFVDAAIVAVARDRGAKTIATFDEDFCAFPDLEVVPKNRGPRSGTC